MDITKDMLLGASTPGASQTPLISFSSIYDLDIGLIRLIGKEYLDESIFDVKFFNRPMISIIKDSYYRTEFNPLTMFAKTNDMELLDDYYNQFMEKRKADIIELCVKTEIENLIQLFIDSKEIYTTIFYNDKYELAELNANHNLDKCKKVYIKGLNANNLRQFSQFYVKDIRELTPISRVDGSKTYYISSFRPNFNSETMELKMDEDINCIIHKGVNHCISIFDMYNENILNEGYVAYENEFRKTT